MVCLWGAHTLMVSYTLVHYERRNPLFVLLVLRKKDDDGAYIPMILKLSWTDHTKDVLQTNPRLGWENCHHQRHSSSSSLLCEELWGPRLHSVARRVCWVDCHLSLGCHLQSLKSCFISITQFRSVLHEKGVKGCWWWCSLRLDEESRFSRGLRGE